MKTETVATVSFDGMIRRKAVEVKRKLSVLTDAHDFHLEVTISGRIHEGHLKFTYTLWEDYNQKVEGNDPDTVVEEFLRRKGWDGIHAPLQISQGEQNEYEI